MSLNKLLAAGRSFAGMRDEKSPFAMRQENLLPVFPAKHRFGHQPGESSQTAQGELLPDSAPGAEGTDVARVSSPAVQTPVRRRSERKRRGWLYYFTFGLLGRSRRSIASDSDLVQSELSLENVRVLRNELENSDLEVVIRKHRVPKPSKPEKPLRPARPVVVPEKSSSWNELTARLFEIGQQ